MNELPNDLEPQDVEDFLMECQKKAEELEVKLEYYLLEFI